MSADEKAGMSERINDAMRRRATRCANCCELTGINAVCEACCASRLEELVLVAGKAQALLRPLAMFADMCNEKLVDLGKGYEPELLGYGGISPIKHALAVDQELFDALSRCKGDAA